MAASNGNNTEIIGNMEFFSITAYDDPDWLSFINNHAESHLFHHPIWLGFLARCYGYHPFLAVVRDSAGIISAGVPFMEVFSFVNSRRWVSLPFTDHCPPLYISRESLLALEKGLIEESRRRNVQDLELRWEYQATELFQSSDHVLTTTSLSSNPTLVREQIKGNDFRKVNLGPKRGITIEKASSLEAMRIYYRLHLETRRRLGVPAQPWNFFKLLFEGVIQPGLGFISLARQNGDYLAGIVFLHWKNTLIYKFSASSQRGRQLAASYPLTWNAIQWGCENNYTLLDWGRSDSDDEGLRDFKKRWASKEQNLIYSSNKKASSSLRQKVKPIVTTFISRSPLWVCRLSGEILYRYFG